MFHICQGSCFCASQVGWLGFWCWVALTMMSWILMKKVFVLSSMWFNSPTDRRGRGCRRGECSIVLERWRQFFLWLGFFGKLGWSLRKFWFETNPQVVIEKKQLRGQVEILKHCQRHNGPEGWVHITRSASASKSVTNCCQHNPHHYVKHQQK